MSSLILDAPRRRLLADLRRPDVLPLRLGYALLALALCGAVYGAALGAWHGPRLALYVAVKVPMLLIATAALTSLFNWTIGALLGLPLPLRQTFSLTVVPLAIAAIVAASLAPVAWFFAFALPPPSASQRTLHNIFYLVHTITLATAGLAGASKLREALLELSGGREAVARAVRFAWVAVYAFVAGELAWILRPFVGSVYLPVVFMRDDALRGNVYEFLFTDVLPHLIRRIFGGSS
jgi:hypothetical protein